MEFLTGFSTLWKIQGLTSMMGKAGGNVLVDRQVGKKTSSRSFFRWGKT